MKKMLVSALLALTLAACSSTPEYMKKVEFEGKTKPIVVKMIRHGIQGDLLKVDAEIMNDSNESVIFKYRTKWTGDNGISVWGEEGWKPEALAPNQSKTLTLVAPSSKATDYRLVLARD